ncbi:elongation of very long chain fatty acids protein 4-like isoform X1 [Acropora millepora]|uniref:elongation of very long chain fatty acids protein 4-like isoform X1 n=2 Tax=Acropora millepora TaxID=45264 RepID=UPI001CF21A3C|nr:elongation of very long chain fatty acids protein 4-like isoform X1 [Acropora millepora]
MTSVQRILQYYQWAMESGDPKTADWPLVATPWPTVAFLAAYLFIVKVGPKIMEKRRAYNLREVLIVYNFAIVLLSAYMMYEVIASVLDIPNFNYLCEHIHYVRGDPKQTRLARAVYIFWMSKFVESFDTVFFILRKKNNQVTFLHVYHHASMCFLWWMVSKYLPGSLTWFGTAMNCFVHVVMYAYYGLAAIGPQMQPYLWWKAHITKLQLTQFVILLVYVIYTLKTYCVVDFFPLVFLYMHLIFLVSLFILFSNFYVQSYLKKNKTSRNSREKKIHWKMYRFHWHFTKKALSCLHVIINP